MSAAQGGCRRLSLPVSGETNKQAGTRGWWHDRRSRRRPTLPISILPRSVGARQPKMPSISASRSLALARHVPPMRSLFACPGRDRSGVAFGRRGGVRERRQAGRERAAGTTDGLMFRREGATMYSRSPNRDGLEVGKSSRRTTAASGIRWLEDGWAEVAEPQGPVAVVVATPLSDAPTLRCGGMGNAGPRRSVKDGRLLPPVCTEAQGSSTVSTYSVVQNSKGHSSESTQLRRNGLATMDSDRPTRGIVLERRTSALADSSTLPLPAASGQAPNLELHRQRRLPSP